MPPGTNSPAQLRLAVDALASRPDIDSLVFVLGADPMAAAGLGDMIAAYAAACAKPVCLCWPAPPPGGVARLAAAGIATFDDSDRALRALAQLATRTAALARPQRESVADMAFDWATHIESYMTVVPEDRCHAILIDAGLPVARGRLAVDAAAALPIAHEIGLPVALKSITATAIDRAGAGLLVTDLRNADEVLAAYRRLEDRARGREIVLDGIYVQRMLRGGVELMVSVVRDPVFGTMVTCGSGAEPNGDRVTLRAPVTEAMAADMVTRLRCRAAARDEQGIFDVAAPAAFIARLSSLGVSAPWRAFTFKVSPIRWTRAGVVAMDGLLVIER